MSDSTTMLDLITEAQAGKTTSANDLFDAASPAMLYGRRASATAGLTWGYYGGRVASTLIPNGAVTLTASATNYIVADMSTGAVSAATTTTNWDDDANYRRLYKIITGTLSVTSYEDHREAAGGGGGGTFTGGALTSALDEAKGANIASAATTNIGAATGNLVHVTGTTTITALGSVQAGTRRVVVFDGILTLTHNATSLILPTSANITTAAGDTATFVSEGSGNWRCVLYQRVNGQALAASSAGMTNPMTTAGDMITGGASGAAQRLAKGTDGMVLTMVSGAPAWAAASGGGLANWVDGVSSSSPNDTVPVTSLLATNVATNVDAALIPKGNGALLAQIPDGLAAGGRKRGLYAVDFQRVRTSSNNVGSGDYSVIGGGSNNRSGAGYAVCVGGRDNNAAAADSFIGGGSGNTLSASMGVLCGGQSSTMSGQWGFLGGGRGNTASGAFSSVVGGDANTASGDYSSISGGANATTRGIQGAEARANGTFSAQGDAQRERFLLRRSTTNDTATVVSADAATPSASNQVVLPNNGTYDFSVRVVARSSSDQASFRITGLITRGASASTTSIVGTPTVTPVAVSAGAGTWSVAVSANTTLGCLTITVTGATSTSIKWVADIETVEVVG